VNAGFVRPSVRSVTNGGKLTIKFDRDIEFPNNFIDQLNANKDSFIVLQVAKEGSTPESIYGDLPVYPVDQATAKLNIDPSTGEQIPIEV